MRSTLLVLIGSVVLVASAMMIWPADVDSKAKWPMAWKNDHKTWTSKPVIIANRPGLYQHNVMAFTVKKKPGSDRCAAKYGLREKGRLHQPLGVTNESSRPKTVWSAVVFELPDSMSGKGFVRLGVQTNGNCEWRLRFWGPRKGEP